MALFNYGKVSGDVNIPDEVLAPLKQRVAAGENVYDIINELGDSLPTDLQADVSQVRLARTALGGANDETSRIFRKNITSIDQIKNPLTAYLTSSEAPKVFAPGSLDPNSANFAGDNSPAAHGSVDQSKNPINVNPTNDPGQIAYNERLAKMGGGAPAPAAVVDPNDPNKRYNIVNPATGQKGYQTEGDPIPPGWQALGAPASSVVKPGAIVALNTPGAQAGGQTATAGSPDYVAPGGAAPVSPAAIPATPLQPGAKGDAVKQLQDFLVAAGYMTAQQVATGPGIYGPQTTAAVAALQKALGVDNASGPGFFGPRTIAAVQAALASQGGSSTGNPGSQTPGGTTPGSTTGAPTTPAGSYTEGSNTNLSSLLASVGIQIGAQTSLTDMVKEISKLYGFDEVNGEIKKLDDTYAEDVAKVNDDPWISEGIRVKRIEKLSDKYDMKKKAYTERLALQGDIIGKAVSLFSAEKSQEQALLLKALDSQLESLKPSTGETTTDIKEYNLAVSQGYKGTFLDWQKQSANLKAVKPSTINVNTSGANSAEDQLMNSRNEGPEADGTYADPNLYASLRSKSTLGAAEFDRRFSYLVNPSSRARLGIKSASSGTIDFVAIPSL